MFDTSRTITIPYVLDNPLMYLYYENGLGERIVMMEGFLNNIKLIHKLRKTDFIIIQLPWHLENNSILEDYSKLTNILCLDKRKITILANEKRDVKKIKQYGFNSIFCNQNCFLDYNSVSNIDNIEKEYDAVIVSRLEKWKRVSITKLIKNLAIISGHIEPHHEDISKIPHRYFSNGWIDNKEILNIIKKSKVGLILSSEEGACWAAGEYLLCGVPVVSTKSIGGRDIWFDEYNSIICEPNETSVLESVQKIISKNKIAKKIRLDFIKKSNIHRNEFIKLTQHIFSNMRAQTVDARKHFELKFVNRMANNFNINYDENLRVL